MGGRRVCTFSASSVAVRNAVISNIICNNNKKEEEKRGKNTCICISNSIHGDKCKEKLQKSEIEEGKLPLLVISIVCVV